MILFIDAEGTRSSTLYHQLAGRTDGLTKRSLTDLQPEHPEGNDVDGIVLSDGPETTRNREQYRNFIQSLPEDLPVLGIQLGFQAIVKAFGGNITNDPPDEYGKPVPIFHRREHLFDGVPLPVSLPLHQVCNADRSSLPPDLLIVADTKDGTVVGIRHVEHPVFGIQFHPSAYLSESGSVILDNFLSVVSASGTVPEAAGDTA